MSRLNKTQTGWNIELTDQEVEQFKEAHFRVEGYKAVIDNTTVPVDAIVIKLGEASAKLKDLGMELAAKEIAELSENPNLAFNWDCDFGNKLLNVTLV